MKNPHLMLSSGGLETLQSRFALRVATRLGQAADELPHDITERLKAAREQALERSRLARRAEVAAGAQVAGNGSSASLAMRGGPRSDLWLKLASLVPLAALVAGFLLIDHLRVKSQISAAAEIDAALLADDLPPAAYSDPGFVEFLKAPRD
jgi:hypothetical protein